MHHVVLDRWSRRSSLIHHREARVKILASLSMLVAIAMTPPDMLGLALAYAAFLVFEAALGHLPVGQLALRAGIVLPFSGTFAVISFLAGDADRAAAVLVKSYLSAFTVLILAGTTPLPRLLLGMESLGAPRMVVLVVQFLYRYLFVISEQGQHMRQASKCRGDLRGPQKRKAASRSRFRAAAGALAVLFAKSYQRAEAIHRSMLSRGFDGHIRTLSPARIRAADITFLLVAGGLPVAVLVAAELGR